MCKAPLVTPERSATSDRDRLSVGFEATPLLGRPTGVGAFCLGALDRARGDPVRGGLGLRRQLAPTPAPRGAGPPGDPDRQRAMPARPLHAAWSRGWPPPVEWFVGRHEVVHGTNFVVPPTRSAARVVTVHDLTVVLYPELCDPPTLRFPDLIRRAVADGAWVHTPSQYVADQVVAEFSIHPERVRAVHHGIPVPPAPGPRPAAPAAPADPPARGVRPLRPGRRDHRAAQGLPAAGVGVRRAGRPTTRRWRWWWWAPTAGAPSALPPPSRHPRGGTGSCVPGYLDDRGLDAVLRHASVLAYPSRYEGFGFPPLQAMAAGVPVVATAAGALPEVVGDGALLVDPGDRDGLAGELEPRPRGGERHRRPGGAGPPAERRLHLGGLRRRAGRPLLGRPPGPDRRRRGRCGERPAPPGDGRAAAPTGLGGDRHLHPRPAPGPRRPRPGRAARPHADGQPLGIGEGRPRPPGRTGPPGAGLPAARPRPHPGLGPGPAPGSAPRRRGPGHLAVDHGAGAGRPGHHRARPPLADGCPTPTRPVAAPGTRRRCAGPSGGPTGSSSPPTWWRPT